MPEAEVTFLETRAIGPSRVPASLSKTALEWFGRSGTVWKVVLGRVFGSTTFGVRSRPVNSSTQWSFLLSHAEVHPIIATN
jgi:hypothetical protein